MEYVLPTEIAEGSSLQDNEYAWNLASFPRSLKRAPTLGYACLGGQFQFRVGTEGVYEMYWLDADSEERLIEESWSIFCNRSCGEVLQKFEQRIALTDFASEAAAWPSSSKIFEDRYRLDEVLVFVAYFVAEEEWRTLTRPGRPANRS